MGSGMGRETKRLVANVTVELLEQIDDYAERMNINRTSAVAVLLSQALNSQKAMSDLGELLKLYQQEAAAKDNDSV